MIIIQLAGGLGNQMFQYALYLQLKSLGRDVKIDDVSGFVEDKQRTPALAAFGIDYERPTRKELRQLLDDSLLPWDRVRRRLFGRKKKSYFEEGKLFMPEVLTWDDIYLEGYWQSERYFQAVEAQVREAYDIDRLLDRLRETDRWSGGMQGGEAKTAQSYLEEIDETCSVSVHVRRGDYLTPENRALFGDICTDTYYIEAIRQMRERHPGCRFFFFSNDKALGREMSWAKNVGTMVALPEGKADNDYAEFALMSRCKHHILANSSFSWWASYLNPNPEKTIFAPPTWINGVDCRDFYRQDMCKMDS